MNDLIVIEQKQIGNEEVNSIDARDLHSRLGLQKKFSDWIKQNIAKLNLVENIDYVTVPQKGTGGKFDTIDYILTLDIGKHIAMMTNTDTASGIRTYFIEFEKRAKALLTQSAPLTPQMQLAHAMLLAGDMIEEQKCQIAQRDTLISIIQPQADALRLIALADGSYCLTDAAKNLGVQPHKVLIPFLSAHKWIYKRAGATNWIAYQDKLQQMLLEHKTTVVSRTDGTEKMTEQVRITGKGLTKLAELFANVDPS
jgi:anti-repressor protein